LFWFYTTAKVGINNNMLRPVAMLCL